MSAPEIPTLESLREPLRLLRGNPATPPDASIAIPVNAQADLDAVRAVLSDLCRSSVPHGLEVVLVVNNYPPEDPPRAIEHYRDAGVTVVAIPSAWRRGEAVWLTARVAGIRAAASDRVVSFDADCRIPDPTSLLSWYVEQLGGGADVAYSRVDYYALRPLWSVRARMVAHHGARWAKRVLLRLPTVRGSNYGVRREAFLALYDGGLLTDDINVGPAAKANGQRIVYSGSRRHVVLTSGRRFQGGWLKLARYLVWRLRYNRGLLALRGTKSREQREALHSKPLR